MFSVAPCGSSSIAGTAFIVGGNVGEVELHRPRQVVGDVHAEGCGDLPGVAAALEHRHGQQVRLRLLQLGGIEEDADREQMIVLAVRVDGKARQIGAEHLGYDRLRVGRPGGAHQAGGQLELAFRPVA